MRYIFSAAKNLTRGDVDEIVKEIENSYAEGSELVMTFARGRKGRRNKGSSTRDAEKRFHS